MSFAQEIENILSQTANETPAFTTLLNAAASNEEDAEDWLNMDPDALEEILQAKQAQQSGDVADLEEAEAQREAEKLSGLANKFETFLQSQGSMDGALLDE